MSGPLLIGAPRRTLAFFVVLIALSTASLLAARPAHAAYRLTSLDGDPSSLQAAGHPKAHESLTPDAVYADYNGGDDLRTVDFDYPAGLLIDPQVVSTRCSAQQLSNSSCPSASRIGALTLKWRGPFGATLTSSGSVYAMSVTMAGSDATFGAMLSTSGYRAFPLSAELTSLATSRSAADAGFGMSVTIGTLPRTLATALFGLPVNVTASNITFDAGPRATTSSSGPYLVTNPTRCSSATSRATAGTYAGASVSATDAFTPTGCGSVTFSPALASSTASTVASAPTALSYSLTQQTASQTIQQSHVRTLKLDLPSGSSANPAAISGVVACTAAQLASDSCPAASQIGTGTAATPLLAAGLSGSVYATQLSPLGYAVVLRGANGNLTFSGSVADVSGHAQVTAAELPQLPFSSLSVAFSTEIVNNSPACGSQAITNTATGWSGAAASSSSSVTQTCVTPPDTTVTSGPSGQTTAPSPTFTFTADASGATFECALDAGDWTACASPYVVPAQSDGPHRFCVRAVAAGLSDPTPACADYVVDGTAPTVTITSPADGSTTATSPVTLHYTATDNSGAAPSCSLADGASIALAAGANTITVLCTDGVGNAGAATVSVTYAPVSPPVVTITSPTPGAILGSTSVTLNFTVTGSPSLVTCRLDGGSAIACSSPQSYTGLADGSHTIVVCATNAGGTGCSTVTFTSGGPPPTVTITQPVNGSTVGSTVTLAFSTSPAGLPTTCKLDSGAATSCASPVTYSGLATGSHTFTVCATDTGGNMGCSNVTATVGLPILLTITSPANGQVLATTTATVTWTVTPSGATVTCALDGGAASACASPTTYSGLAQGRHTVVVCGSNANGTSCGSVTFTVDTVAPVVTVTSPVNGQTTGSSVSLAFTAADATTGVTGVTCKLDSGAATACSSGMTYTGLSGGTHTFTVCATDGAGNVGCSSVVVTSQLVPVVTISSPANGSDISGTSVNLAFTATNSPTQITCQLDGGSAAACSSPVAYNALADGSHTIVVCATNAAGTGCASVSFTAGGPPPTVTITQPVNGSTVGSTVTLAFSTSPAGLPTTCKLDSGAATSCASPVTYSGLATGSHTFTVCATDIDGNTGCSNVTATVGLPILVSITSPASGQALPTTTATVTFTVTPGSATVTCALDGGAQSACASPATYPGLAQGSHTVVVCGSNANGTLCSSVTFIVDSAPPVVAITSPTTGTDPYVLTFTAADATTSVVATTCKLDSGAATSCASGQSYSGLSSGTHTLTVCAIDQAGNTGCSTITISIAPQTFSPTFDQTLTDSTAGNPTDFSWDFTAPASSDSIATTRVVEDPSLGPNLPAFGQSADRCPASSMPTLGSAFDTANCPAASRVGTFTAATSSSTVTGSVYLIDKAPLPWFGIKLTSPIPGSTVTSLAVTTTLPQVDPTCDSSVDFCQQQILFAIANLPQVAGVQYRLALDSSGRTSGITGALPSGLYVVDQSSCQPQLATNARFTSSTGLTAGVVDSDPIDCQPPDNPPSLAITHPITGTVTSASTDTLQYTASDDSGIAPTCTPANGSTLNYAVGVNTVTVTCTDNVGQTNSRTVQVTRIGPPPTPTCTPGSTSVTCTWTPAAGYTATCRLDGGAATNCTPPWTVTGLAPGAHTVTICFTDVDGNTGCASFTFTIGATPTVTITGGPAEGSTITTSTATFSFVSDQPVTQPTPCSDPNQICVQVVVDVTPFYCNVDGGAYVACGGSGLSTGSSYTTGVLANGAHTFCVYTTSGASTSPTVCRHFTVSTGTLTFSPSFSQTLNDSTAGDATDLSWDFAAPATSDSIATLKIGEDAKLGANFAAFGASVDMCPTTSMPQPTSTFVPTGCPAQAKVGSATVTTPSGTVSGSMYLINHTPIPWLGVALDSAIPDTSTTTFAFSAALPQVDPACDAAVDFCQTHIVYTLRSLPNVAGAQYDVTLDSSGRTSPTTGALAAGLFVTDGDNCQADPSLPTTGQLTSSTGLAASVVDTDTLACGGQTDPPPVILITSPVNGSSTTDSSGVLHYTASDDSGLAPACTPADGTTLSYVTGANTVTVSCTDNTGHTTTASVTVTYGPATTPMSDFAQVAVAGSTACATTTGHTARCWGAAAKTLAQGSGGDSSTPLDVRGSDGNVLGGIAKISPGSGGSACVLMQETTVKCWGYNAYGQTGDGTSLGGTTAPSTVVSGPGSGSPLTGVRDITTRGITSCALMSDATVKCWGYNGAGGVGDGTTTDRSTPTTVISAAGNSTPLTGVTSLSPSGGHTCAVVAGAQVVCWGDNNTRAINDTGTNAPAPVSVFLGGGTSGTPLSGAVQAAGGTWTSCVRMNDATAECWGLTTGGELGTGNGAGVAPSYQSDPRPVVTSHGGSTPLGSIASLDDNGQCAVITDGTLSCWGSNSAGSVGDGTTTDRDYAVSVVSGAGQSTPLTGVVQSSGLNSRCALLSSGQIKCWGSNASGQLGDGTTTNRSAPVSVGG